MPGGRPKKKGGKPKREDVDLKLPKVRREAAVKKLRRPVNEAMVEQNNNDDGDRKVEEEVLEELEGEVENVISISKKYMFSKKGQRFMLSSA